MLISIGRFSKTCSVSIKALRYYDKVGLLKPTKVDSETGYRYYEENQLKEMNIISRLKRYGFSLIEIKAFLDAENKDIMLFKLREQYEAIECEVKHKKMLAKEINNLIEEFERTGEFMSYENNYNVELTTSKEIYIISSRQKMSIEDFGKYYSKLFERVATQNIKTSGETLAIYYDKEFNEKCSDIEVAVGVEEREKADRCIESGLCATVVHKGSYANLAEAYSTLLKWINENGYKISAPPYEIYIKGICSNLPVDEWETQVFFPIEK